MKDFPIKKGLTLLFILALSSGIFYGLYRFDNKYTQTATQAADGLLVLSKADLQKDPIRYLTYGWEFYPGVVLSPDDLNDGLQSRYMVHTMIGERTRFDFGDGNPHGSGSYLLRMRLPKESAVYALELPEIFSACHLYVDGKLLFSSGNPDPDNYTGRTASRVVTFEASERAVILIAVSDFSHFYSGLIYPPTFGTPEAVDSARTLRLWLRIAVLSVTVIAGLLALYLGLRMKQQNSKLFVLLCVAMSGLISYPLIHAMLTLPVFPWYTIELFCSYSVPLIVVILHNRLCDTQYTIRRISNGIACAVCYIAVFYGLLSPYLTVPVMNGFSIIVFVYKAAVAIYLPVTAFSALKSRPNVTRPLFYAALVYAAAFAWDRLLPFYEPVYGGWFPEIGSIVLVSVLGYTLWRDMVDAYANSLAFAEEHRQVTRQLSMQLEYAGQLTKRTEENRRLIHDFRQHLRAIDGLAQESGAAPVRDYLRRVTQLTADLYASEVSFCQNAAVDALLGFYYNMATKSGINMTSRLILPDELPLTDVKLCTVIGNLLENALEACERQQNNDRRILISSMVSGATFFLLVENSYDGILEKHGELFVSRKSGSAHVGVGLASVRQIVEQTGGTLDIFPEGLVFKVGCAVPLYTL